MSFKDMEFLDFNTKNKKDLKSWLSINAIG